MLGIAISSFLLAVVAAVFGFGGLAGSLAPIAQFLTVLFIVMFIVSIVYSIVMNRHVDSPL